MKNASIIAEYDPFHNGHAWQIRQLHKLGAQTVTIALGGDFTQRGRPATFRKATRAKAALLAGADLVVELPIPFSCASARQFAAGGVFLLASLGFVDTLCFGAETANIDQLKQLSLLLSGEEFSQKLKQKLEQGISWPAARAAAAEEALPGAAKILAGPNNILALAYLEAIHQQNASLSPLPLLRQGAAHGASLPSGSFASASFLRSLLQQHTVDALAPYVPDYALQLYRDEEAQGLVSDEQAFSRSMLTVLRTLTPARAARLPGAGGEGLAQLLCRSAQKAGTADELYEGMKSKRYTHARLRRLALEGYLSLFAPLPQAPACLRILGASENGIELLRQAKKSAKLPVVFSLAEQARLGDAAAQQSAITAHAGALYALCMKKAQPADLDFRQKFIRVSR